MWSFRPREYFQERLRRSDGDRITVFSLTIGVPVIQVHPFSPAEERRVGEDLKKGEKRGIALQVVDELKNDPVIKPREDVVCAGRV